MLQSKLQVMSVSNILYSSDYIFLYKDCNLSLLWVMSVSIKIVFKYSNIMDISITKWTTHLFVIFEP